MKRLLITLVTCLLLTACGDFECTPQIDPLNCGEVTTATVEVTKTPTEETPTIVPTQMATHTVVSTQTATPTIEATTTPETIGVGGRNTGNQPYNPGPSGIPARTVEDEIFIQYQSAIFGFVRQRELDPNLEKELLTSAEFGICMRQHIVTDPPTEESVLAGVEGCVNRALPTLNQE